MAVSDDIDIPQSVNEGLPSDTHSSEAPLGEVLSAARIAKKLTQQDVSDSLRYSIKQIDALESNRFDALPDAMITRGFIRNYARLLEIDAEPLLASYRGRMPDKQQAHLSVQSSMQQVQLSKDSQPWLKYILGSIVVLLFLVAWFFYMEYQSKAVTAPVEKTPEAVASDAASTAPEATPSLEMPLPEIALPAAERQAEDATTVSGVATDMNGAAVSSAGAEALPANQAAGVGSPAVQPSPAQPSAVQPQVSQPTISQPAVSQPTPDAVAKKNVSISVTEKTWVSVTDKSGKVVFEKMLSAGATEGFDALPPLSVVVGNAKAAQLTYAGKPVDLSTQTGSNVARIRLE